MEEYQIEPETKEIENKITETLIIDQNEKKFKLELVIKGEMIFFNLYEEGKINNKYYSQKLSLREIKNKHQIFCVFNSCQEFLDYIKASFDNKKLSIKITNESLSILMNIEYLFKQQIIEIPLEEKKMNIEDFSNDIIKEISFLKDKIISLEENIEKMKYNFEEKMNNQNKEINNLKEENNKLKDEIKCIKNDFYGVTENFIINSNILKSNEYKMISLAINKRINKKIKEIKKIYQATKDGGDPCYFHSKCDKINNTLVLIHSEGNNRFGGFTSNFWESTKDEVFKDDKNAFVFSLDENKIYPYKNDGKAIRCFKNYGPYFGSGPLIGIRGNPFKDENLRTFRDGTSYDINNDFLNKNATDNVVDYEVFQIIFE